MKKEELFALIGDVDESFVTSAGKVMVRRKRPRWVKLSAAAACLCLVLAGAVVASNLNGRTAAKGLYFPNRNAINGTFFAEMAPEYMSRSVAEMFEKADAVVVATVVQDETQWKSEPSGLENALSTVAVEECWKGAVGAGEEAVICETGWRYDDHDLSVGGEPILRKGMRVVLFLTGETNGERCVCGSYQGKIFLDENGVAHPYSFFTKGQEGYPGFSDMKEPMKLENLKALCKA